MIIFGTIGLAVRFTSAESGFVASMRGILGGLFILLFVFAIKKKPDFKNIRRNLPLLICSGAAIGINWIFLFEAYNHTTIAVATLCYYMAPVFVILASPIVLGAKITRQKYIAAAVAVVGMFLVSGVNGGGSVRGVLLALGAALMYTTLTILSKKLTDISPYDTTVVQLLTAGIILLPYTIFAESNNMSALDGVDILIILLTCLLHTAVAYLLFFSAVRDLPAETVAIFGYLDPIVAVICSLILREPMTIATGIGGVLIVASLILSEINLKRPK